MFRHSVSIRFDRLADAGRKLSGKRSENIFSGGAAKGEADIMDEARAIRDGGGNGSIIGRNTFQRPRAEALKLLENIIGVYKGER